MQEQLVDQLCKQFPGMVDLVSQNYCKVPKHIEQEAIEIDDADNDIALLAELLKEEVLPKMVEDLEAAEQRGGTDPAPAVIVFCRGKGKRDWISEELRNREIINLPFYEAMSSKARNLTLSLLNEGKLPVMISDELGSRGLDTLNVSHVIQFDFARTPQDYLQRIGRTGRMGQPGKVINFIRERDMDLYKKILKKIENNESLD